MKLVKERHYFNDGAYKIYLVDINYIKEEHNTKSRQQHGEFIWVDRHNNILKHGFVRNGSFIGKFYDYENYFYSSMITKQIITECEYRKELVLLRLGKIEAPPEFGWLLKDYDYI